MRLKIKIGFVFLLAAAGTFAQAKKELEDKIIQQQKTIDSLKAVISNMENIIENRDRSIQIYVADEEKYLKSISDFNIALDNCRTQNAGLRQRQSVGTAKLMAMTNDRAMLKAPEGKMLIINQMIGDYTSSISTDSLGNVVTEEIHVFMKTLNGKTLTDISNKQFGPKLYSSIHPEQTIQFPIILPAGTSLSIVVLKGEIGNLQIYDGMVTCSYTEK
ncbi:MAG: hypothetical protein R2780_03710 [Crocinitomicaceae bacterium]|nr:hypothetical protein [Crocinitomicaceae bacterium]